MPLTAAAADLLAILHELGGPALHEMPLAEARGRNRPRLGGMPALHEIRDIAFPTPTHTIPTRLYVPEWDETGTDPQRFPIILFFHGGGWVLSDIQQYDHVCAEIANTCRAVVLSVEYRLAPEHPFPAGLEDCLSIARAVRQGQLPLFDAQTPLRWKSDRGQMFVMGDSAGGNLAAVVANSLATDVRLEVRGQILIYPITDADLQRPSYQENATGYALTTELMAWFWDQYCPDPQDRFLPEASPLRHPCLSIAPPTFSLTVQYDPLRDEGNAYAAQLADAGVAVEHREWPGLIHGCLWYTHRFPEVQQMLTQLADWMTRQTDPQ